MTELDRELIHEYVLLCAYMTTAFETEDPSKGGGTETVVDIVERVVYSTHFCVLERPFLPMMKRASAKGSRDDKDV
jgi:hypothetical protein